MSEGRALCALTQLPGPQAAQREEAVLGKPADAPTKLLRAASATALEDAGGADIGLSLHHCCFFLLF